MVGRLKSVAALAALYLPGAPFGSGRNSGWPRVVRALEGSDDPEAALRQAGLVEEAAALTHDALAWGLAQVEAEAVLTALDDAYPIGWVDRLGQSAPPAVWRRGAVPSGPWVTVVGSRGISATQLAVAGAVGGALVQQGWGVVSGGARGTDRAAIDGARGAGRAARVLEILPEGIEMARPGVTSLAANAPESGFRAPQAMYRNRLLYAWSGRAVIVAVREGTGGTWHGARAALKEGLAALFVRRDGTAGAQALIERGAIAWETVDELMVRLREPLANEQPGLFDAGGTGRLRGRDVPFD